MKSIIVFLILAAALEVRAEGNGFTENEPLFQRLLSEKQAVGFGGRVKTLINVLEGFKKIPNFTENPAKFKITNKNGENFDFEVVKSGSFTPGGPICEYFEIHLSGHHSDSANQPWMIGTAYGEETVIEIKFHNEQCV
jgi:hypothetical protein